MPSYQQLEAEPWWGREIVTPELDWLGDELCRRTGRPRSAWGDKGNNAHLSGGHRSQEWIRNSDYCTNTSYTVQSGLSAEQLRHIGAGDFTPGVWGTAANRALMAKHTKALFDAARAGQLTGARQIFGTLDGVRAIGLNVVSNSITTPDSSHLDHLHFTFDRQHMRDIGLMRRIADIVTGDDMLNQAQDSALSIAWEDAEALTQGLDNTPARGRAHWGVAQIKKLVAASAADETRDAVTLAAIQALVSGGTNVDTAVIVAKITAEANATRDLVEQRHAAEMAELARVHATQLAERDAEKAGLQAELDRLNAD